MLVLMFMNVYARLSFPVEISSGGDTSLKKKQFRSYFFRLFPVDASRAGEGQLEISINDGDVPNAVQVRNSTFPFLTKFFLKKKYLNKLGLGRR